MATPQIHPQSFRALAYELLNALHGAQPTDDTAISIYMIEAELRHQFGLIMAKRDIDMQRMGGSPEPWRLFTQELVLSQESCLGCNDMQRSAELGPVLMWHGKPYLTSMRVCDTEIVPVDHVYQLKTVSRQTSMPTYALQSGQAVVNLTIQTMAMDNPVVTGIWQDYFGKVEQNNPALWAVAWPPPEDVRAMVKERAEIRLKGGAVATWMRADKVNNGRENAMNNP